MRCLHTAKNSSDLFAQGSAHTIPFPSPNIQTKGLELKTALPKVTQQESGSQPGQETPRFLLCPPCIPVIVPLCFSALQGSPICSPLPSSLSVPEGPAFSHPVPSAGCSLYLKCPSSTLTPPFTLLLPGKLLLIIQGPANSLLLQEAFPDPQPNSVGPILLFDHSAPLNHSD